MSHKAGGDLGTFGQVAWYNQRSMVFIMFTSNSPTALNVPQNKPEGTRKGRGHTEI